MNRKVAINKLIEQCDFDLVVEPEDVPYKGNCSVISPEEDAKTEKWIADQLKRGNQWAWCTVKVTATYGQWYESDYLGCCSYLSREDFMQKGGYYDDMKYQAASALLDRLLSLAHPKPEKPDQAAIETLHDLGIEA